MYHPPIKGKSKSNVAALVNLQRPCGKQLDGTVRRWVTLHFTGWGQSVQIRKFYEKKSSSHPPAGLASLAVGGLAAGGLSPALCNLSHTIFSSLCWLLFTIAMAPPAVDID